MIKRINTTEAGRIRLSYSSLETLNSCERKFQLEKLMGADREEEQAYHVGGRAFGAAVASYLAYQDVDKALWELWLNYYPKIEDMKGRTQVSYVNAFLNSINELDNILADNKLMTINGKPAAELSFKMNISDRFYFVGYIDAVLQSLLDDRMKVFECKHTSMQLTDLTPLYKNSGQALGYSIILDKIAGENQSEYDVLYFVTQMLKDYKVQVHPMPFQKTLLDRLNWFITLKLDVQRIEQMLEIGIFPKRGSSCLRFNRPCYHFGTCHLTSQDSELRLGNDESKEVYDFEYDLDELITDHINRINSIS